MLPDWVSNPGPLTYESGALPIALRGPAIYCENDIQWKKMQCKSFSLFTAKNISLYFGDNCI